MQQKLLRGSFPELWPACEVHKVQGGSLPHGLDVEELGCLHNT
jgi:hypothetical protein